MQKNYRTNIVFKDYSPNQILLLPPSLEEIIESSHPLLIVNQVIESLYLDNLIKKYKEEVTSIYNPKIILKFIVFIYLSNLYSSLKIAHSLHLYIYFMSLSAISHPYHNTINLFLSERLNIVLKEIFSQFVLLLVESVVISINKVFLHFTKIKTNSNTYTFFCSKSIKTNK